MFVHSVDNIAEISREPIFYSKRVETKINTINEQIYIH